MKKNIVRNIVKTGVGIGVGSMALGSLGTKVGRDVGAGSMVTVARYAGPIATLTMGNEVLRHVRKHNRRRILG